MIQIKTPHEIELMRASGLVTAGAIAAVKAAVRPGVSTGELDAIAEDHIRSKGAVPNFLGYHGFTGTICASINDEIVHGIPNPERQLAEGDNISIDCGAILQGWHSDSAVTVTVGEPSAEDAGLLQVTERSMWAGLARALAGGRLTDISHAVEETITAESQTRGHRYGIVDHYGGHGIGTEMHQDPHVLNYGRPGRGPKLVPGLTLAIEPMVTVGDPATVELEDGWTVVTKDGSRAAHFEHTVAITPEGPWVLTAEDGGVAGLAPFGITPRS
jgi:methionyl aminopeptidase